MSLQDIICLCQTKNVYNEHLKKLSAHDFMDSTNKITVVLNRLWRVKLFQINIFIITVIKFFDNSIKPIIKMLQKK
ncbi:MAG TPA: hypothetical protein DC015_01125 [Aequorivita sp.]|nr:hypothetical protein [Aequorivita sp.]